MRVIRTSVSVSIKRMAAMTALAAMCALPAQAQRLGIVAGGTFSQLQGLKEVKAKNRNGTMLGVTLTLPVGEKVAFQPELQFINKGGAIDYGNGGAEDVQLDYMDIPLLLRFDQNPSSTLNPHFFVGPSIGFNVGCNVTSSGSGIPDVSSDCTRDNFKPKTLDWGAVVGAGLDLSLGGLGVTGGARYGIGLANISDDNSDAFKDRVRNGTLTIYAGLVFGHR